jgi:hypothetical protein
VGPITANTGDNPPQRGLPSRIRGEGETIELVVANTRLADQKRGRCPAWSGKGTQSKHKLTRTSLHWGQRHVRLRGHRAYFFAFGPVCQPLVLEQFLIGKTVNSKAIISAMMMRSSLLIMAV